MAALLVVSLIWATLPSLPFRVSTPASTSLAGGETSAQTDAAATTAGVHLQSGRVGVNHTPLYHCRSMAHSSGKGRTATTTTQNIVLLHGAAFTKENWKTSGILERLCATSVVARQVTALDLPVQASSVQLLQILDDLAKSGYVTQLPLTALVTPSASGKAVVEWHAPHDDASTPKAPLRSYVSTWIPVASNSVATVQPPESLSSRFEGVKVLAMYGDKDATGRNSMALLQQYVLDTELVEIPGRHPCYLDSPDVFVTTINSHLEVGSDR